MLWTHKLPQQNIKITNFLTQQFKLAGYELVGKVTGDPNPESAKYNALSFTVAKTLSARTYRVVYRQANITPDRPGAFLSLWKRPSVCISTNKKNNKPIPLDSDEFDFLFIRVENKSDYQTEEPLNINSSESTTNGYFLFPTAVLTQKGIVASIKHKGKTAFRVFPPWSKGRDCNASEATKRFSQSAKKTQQWQVLYFVDTCVDTENTSRALANLLSS